MRDEGLLGVEAVNEGVDTVLDNDSNSRCRGGDKEESANKGLGLGSLGDRKLSDQYGGQGLGDGQDHLGKEEHDHYDDGRNSEHPGLEEQMMENKMTWELAKESGAMLYNEEDDIMVILQEQNEEIAKKKRLAKQKAKARKSRPKIHKKVCNTILR
ncbi:hypothetical protein AHAS_Ahas13G0236000 [Arachis hypogaea]